MKKYNILIIFFAGILFLGACKKNEDSGNNKPIANTQPKFKKEGELTFSKPDGAAIIKLDIEIADNEAEQQQGLMNRSFMSNTHGMLFVFDKETMQGFWMRNTIIPLDIIYINSKFEIVHVAENTQPYSEKTIPSQRPAQYVVEVNAGFCAQYNITDGCKINYARI